MNQTGIIFDRHKYAPELNTLHLMKQGEATQMIKVGFFAMNYFPTMQQAINYAYSQGMITDDEIEAFEITVETVANVHNTAFWQGETEYIHPITGKTERVGYKLMKNWDNFHQNIR